jgi:hypothetical protein
MSAKICFYEYSILTRVIVHIEAGVGSYFVAKIQDAPVFRGEDAEQRVAGRAVQLHALLVDMVQCAVDESNVAVLRLPAGGEQGNNSEHQSVHLQNTYSLTLLAAKAWTALHTSPMDLLALIKSFAAAGEMAVAGACCNWLVATGAVPELAPAFPPSLKFEKHLTLKDKDVGVQASGRRPL